MLQKLQWHKAMVSWNLLYLDPHKHTSYLLLAQYEELSQACQVEGVSVFMCQLLPEALHNPEGPHKTHVLSLT